jgi:hypothetical protein
MRWVRHIAGMGDIRNAYKIFVRKSEGNEAFEKFWGTWENNFEVIFKEMKMQCVRMLTGLNCLSIVCNGGLL